MKDNTLTTKNTVFFSSASDDYIFNAATSLLSIRKFLPDAQLFILSRKISKKNKRFLRKKQISYVELDLTYLFFQSFSYPIECFYLFAGPKIFREKGFKYSVYIDGDVLCLNNPLQLNETIVDIAGVEANKYSDLFNIEIEAISKLFKLNPADFEKKRINSGVIYMNNRRLEKCNFLEEAGRLFRDCWRNNNPRKGDDSLFALFQLVHNKELQIKRLSADYNYIPHYNGFVCKKSIIFFHFSMDKPWKIKPYSHADTNQNVYNNYVKIWREINRTTSFSRWLFSLAIFQRMSVGFKRISKFLKTVPFVLSGLRYPLLKKRKNLKKPPILLYWWEPLNITNFGDLVRSRTYEAFFPLIAVMLIYFILEGILGTLVRVITDRMDPRKRKNGLLLKGVKEHD